MSVNVKKIGWMGFHSGRPHLDDLLAAVIGCVLGLFEVEFMDPKSSVNLILDASGISNALARQMSETGRDADGVQLYAAWIGTTPNGGTSPVSEGDQWWSPYDEHGSGNPADSATELMLHLAGDDKAIGRRLQTLFRGWGIRASEAQVAESVEKLHHMVAYTTMKDNFPVAMRGGISWLLKQLNRVCCFQIGEGGKIREESYSSQEVLRDLRWIYRLLVTYMTSNLQIETSDLAAVDQEMVHWYLQREDVSPAWKPDTAPRTMAELTAMIRTEVRRKALEAKKANRAFSPPSTLLRRLRSLTALVSDLRNPSNWASVEAWMLHQWMGGKKVHLGMNVGNTTTIQEVIANLAARAEALKESARADTPRQQEKLEGWIRQLQELQLRVEDEEQTRQLMAGDERMDERTAASPYGVVATTVLLLRRSRRTDGLAFPEGQAVAEEYLFMALDALWGKMLLAEAASRQIQEAQADPTCTPAIAVDWQVKGVEQPGLLHSDGINPETPAEARRILGKGQVGGRQVKRLPLILVTCEKLPDGTPFGSAYLGADQRYFGTDWTDGFFRHITSWLRVMELRRQGNPLPEDLDTLEAPDKVQDHVWFLHLNGDGKAVQVMAKSLHRRDSPGTELDAKQEILAAQLVVYTVFCAWRSLGVFGSQQGRLSLRARDSALRALRHRLAGAEDMAAELQLILSELRSQIVIHQTALLPLRESKAPGEELAPTS